MVLIDNERLLKVNENLSNLISEESTVNKSSSHRFSSATSQIVIFGEIAKLTNFANKNVHIEFWLEPSRGWFPYDGDDRSLCGLTHRCYSSTSTTSVGAPFQFIIAECNTKSNESEISNGFTLYFRVVNNHSLGRSSTEAFGILKFPFRPGKFSREIKMFRPHSNRISDKLMEYFLNYSFDLDELEEVRNLIPCIMFELTF
uniref:Uncharacterized protein n=1 Tax=Tetranychus urticae TaxID=32264 RepID=T1KEF7_TETUR